MKVLGNILHLANSNKLIVKTNKTPPAGAFVFTNDKNKIGRVSGVFGPVKSPYVSVNIYKSINKRDLENRCGEKLFVSTKKETKQFKKSKSSNNPKKSRNQNKSKGNKRRKNKSSNRNMKNKSSNKKNNIKK